MTSGPPPTRSPEHPGRLTRASRVWRVVTVTAALVVLLVAQFADTNDWFPLGSLSQYASAHDPNGTVRSTFVVADTDRGRVVVPLSTRGVGVGRGEIENQAARLIAHPELLQGIADAHARLHPDQPAYRTVVLVRSVHRLSHGVPVGTATTTELARWEVRR